MSALYREYRGEKYFRARNKFEPWYTKKVNDSIGKDPTEIDRRKRGLFEFLKKHLSTQEITQITRVLDYGGDMGQFIPEELGTEKYVFEVSNVQPVAGVKRIEAEGELSKLSFDFLIVSNVLEHLSDPAKFLAELNEKIRLNKGAYIYIEVPFENFTSAMAGKSWLYRRYLHLVSKSKLLLTLFDFYSTFFRLKFGIIPIFGFLKQGEHINYFSAAALNSLVAKVFHNRHSRTEVFPVKSPSGLDHILCSIVKI